MEPIIQVENIAKRFWIGQSRERGARHWLEKTLRNPFSVFQAYQRKEFWALRDINFTLPRGQKLGIIGRNGAGKSTLLKLISRITLPSQGLIRLNGRVGSLLEVGTGFHPELTGRENIFLNGALLGMSRAEIARNFDAIVDFAEVAEFLETPVKHYSSGMYVRLAFSIAAHLPAEILIVDEVLAVGDSRFQKKCIEKMNEVGRSGRTIIFVSHQLSLVQSVCTHGLLIDQGRQVAFGDIDSVLAAYQKNSTHTSIWQGGAVDLAALPRPNQRPPVLKSARILLEKTEALVDISAQLPPHAQRELNIVLRVTNELGAALFTLSSLFQHSAIDVPSTKLNAQARFTIPQLRDGTYFIGLELYSRDTLIDEVPNALAFETNGAHTNHSYAIPSHFGPLIVNARWTLEAQE